MPATAPEITRLTRTASAVSRRFQTLLEVHLRPHGLTTAQYAVLDTLVSRPPGPPARLSEIAQEVGLGQPAVTKIAAKFADAGWVEIATGGRDARERLIVPTELAVDVLVLIRKALAKDLDSIFGEMPAEQRDALGIALDGFLERLEAD